MLKRLGPSDKLPWVPAIKIAALNNALNVTAGAGNPAILILLLLSWWFMLTFTWQNEEGGSCQMCRSACGELHSNMIQTRRAPKTPRKYPQKARRAWAGCRELHLLPTSWGAGFVPVVDSLEWRMPAGTWPPRPRHPTGRALHWEGWKIIPGDVCSTWDSICLFQVVFTTLFSKIYWGDPQAGRRQTKRFGLV